MSALRGWHLPVAAILLLVVLNALAASAAVLMPGFGLMTQAVGMHQSAQGTVHVTVFIVGVLPFVACIMAAAALIAKFPGHSK